jgi:uncharacterized protein (DUF983 family)
MSLGGLVPEWVRRMKRGAEVGRMENEVKRKEARAAALRGGYASECPKCGELFREAPIVKTYQQIREQTIDECIQQLGGRYGAAVTKDLRVLKEINYG